MRQANRLALFTGNVRAWQDVNTLLASELQVQGDGTVGRREGGDACLGRHRIGLRPFT